MVMLKGTGVSVPTGLASASSNATATLVPSGAEPQGAFYVGDIGMAVFKTVPSGQKLGTITLDKLQVEPPDGGRVWMKAPSLQALAGATFSNQLATGGITSVSMDASGSLAISTQVNNRYSNLGSVPGLFVLGVGSKRLTAHVYRSTPPTILSPGNPPASIGATSYAMTTTFNGVGSSSGAAWLRIDGWIAPYADPISANVPGCKPSSLQAIPTAPPSFGPSG